MAMALQTFLDVRTLTQLPLASDVRYSRCLKVLQCLVIALRGLEREDVARLVHDQGRHLRPYISLQDLGLTMGALETLLSGVTTLPGNMYWLSDVRVKET